MKKFIAFLLCVAGLACYLIAGKEASANEPAVIGGIIGTLALIAGLQILTSTPQDG